MKRVSQFLGSVFRRLFHTRSIIIISPHRTKHLSVSGSLQFLAVAGAATCVGWASYSTGSFVAARNVLQQRDETIKSVAGARVEENYGFLAGNSGAPMRMGPEAVSPANVLALTDPAFALNTMDQDKLYERIASLETKVKELKSVNTDIVNTVREKTQNKIIDMEEVIRSTGLNLDTLKKEALRSNKVAARKAAGGNMAAEPATDGPRGGPFLPDEVSNSPVGPELDAKLDHMMVLNEILGKLPIAKPISGAARQSGFGRRVDPFNGRLAFHAGLDLSGSANAPVVASAPGKVVSAGWNGAYGNAVDVSHGLGLVTRYGHLSSIRVKSGQVVERGQTLGTQGSTGRSTGPHLHYEVRYYDKPLNPVSFLNAGANVSKID